MLSRLQLVRGRLRQLGLEVRAGLHTGECDKLYDGGFRGPAVDLAEGVCRLASGNEILVSSTLKDLVAGSGLCFGSAEGLSVSSEEGAWQLYRVQSR